MNQVSVICETGILGRRFQIYGTFESPLFLARDVAEWIEHSDVSTMTSMVDDDEKLTQAMFVSGQTRQCNFLTESGVYEVLMLSRKPIAKEFKKAVKQILHEIRRHGGYIAAAPEDTPETIMARAVLVAQATIDRQKAQLAAQTEQLRLQAPAVEYVNNVLASDSLITINAVAQHLGISAIRLNRFLIEREWIYKQGGIYYASRKVRDRGYFDFHVVPYVNSAGDKCTRSHLKATEAGRRAIIELWEKHQRKGA